MKFNKIKASKFLFLSLFLSINISAAEEGVQSSGSSDPFARTDYAKAFNPKVLDEFSDVRKYDGSIINTPRDFFVEIPEVAKRDAIIPVSLDATTCAARKILMKNALIENLTKCKRDAALRAVYESGLSFALQAICLGSFMRVSGTDSMGGSFAGLLFANSLAYFMRQAIPAVCSYIYPGNDPYARFEQQFAEKMSYIPYQLWPQIIDTFGAARIGRFSYVRATNFFDIAFNLPSMHRFPYVPPLKIEEIVSKTGAINHFTDQFFRKYEDSDANLKLGAATRKYLKKLAHDEDGFVCVHLAGPGGVGKTHYIKALASKIAEVLGTDIPVEEINIRGTEASELEGDQNTPGKVLAALSRVAKKDKPYGILVFDEAAWLNCPLKETAKKMFEPNLGSFRSQYLDGMDFSLKGFLIAFMSNKTISDRPLRSRMIDVKFPTLKKESLETMALAKLRDQFLDGTGLSYENVFERQEITQAIEDSKTMRDIETKFPAAIEEIMARG